MSYYCSICDKSIKLKSRNKHLKSITHNELEKSIHINHSVENPNFFDVDDKYNDFVNIHNKKYYFYFVKCNFNLVFDSNFYRCIESILYNNTMICYWKEFLINAIQHFIKKGNKFSHISNMNIITINNKMNMTYEHYITLPMQAVELKLNMIIAKNPNLINSLNRFYNHLLIRKYSHIPFNN